MDNKVYIVTEDHGGYETIVGVCSTEVNARKSIEALEYLRGPGIYEVEEYKIDAFKDQMILELSEQLINYEVMMRLLNNLKNDKNES